MCGPSVNQMWAFMARCFVPTSLLFLPSDSWSCFVSRAASWQNGFAIAESKVSYTNNVTNFSAARRLKFSEDPSQPTALPSQLSDVIWDPSLEANPIFFVEARA